MHFFVAKLLSIAVITYTNVLHVRPMTGRFITHTANILQLCKMHATVARRLPRDPTASFLENPCEYPYKLYIARNYRVPILHDSCYSMGLSVFHFTQLFSKAMKVF